MKTYELDITPYPVDFERWVIKDEKRTLDKGTEDLNVANEIADMLRLPGIYDSGVESFDGLMLGREFRAWETGTFSINEEELTILKKVFDKLIKREHNPSAGSVSLGGVRYEEMIIRVFGLGKE